MLVSLSLSSVAVFHKFCDKVVEHYIRTEVHSYIFYHSNCMMYSVVLLEVK